MAALVVLLLPGQVSGEAPLLEAVVVIPARAFGGTLAQGTVRLNGPAQDGGELVILSTSMELGVQPILVPAGLDRETFHLQLPLVSEPVDLIVTAAVGGERRVAVVRVMPAPILEAIAVERPQVVAGDAVTATVFLRNAVPDTLVTVELEAEGCTSPSSGRQGCPSWG